MQIYGKTLTYNRIFPIFCNFAVKININMKYFEAKFTISPYSSDASDILATMAGEVGFETFEDTPTGLLGYIQQSDYSETALQEALKDFPFEGVSITYEVHQAEDRNWNEQWEQEGFEPIVIPPSIIIHDGRHLPDLSNEQSVNIIPIEIDTHLAFGTGNHETTRMICDSLQKLLSHSATSSDETAPLIANTTQPRILDCGTGTGILSICALKLGARNALGYDIDEWSVDNARHNAIINLVDDRFEARQGDATILSHIDDSFDIVLANINRNILLHDMPLFKERMSKGALLILSGFYTKDTHLLIEKASDYGLTLLRQMEENDWACLIFRS